MVTLLKKLKPSFCTAISWPDEQIDAKISAYIWSWTIYQSSFISFAGQVEQVTPNHMIEYISRSVNKNILQ